MTKIRISLSLPELESGQEPPVVCPYCGERALKRSDVAIFEEYPEKHHWYGLPCNPGLPYNPCGASYYKAHGIKWVPHKPCGRPNMSAVLRAVVENLTPEQRERTQWAIGYSGEGGCTHSAVDCIEFAADDLEEHEKYKD